MSDRFLDLVEAIYDAAVEPDRWQHVLREMMSLLGAESGLVCAGSAREPPYGLAVPYTVEVDPEQQARWLGSYLDQDLWWHAFYPRWDERVLTGAQCVPVETLRASAIYNEVLRHAKIEDGLFAGLKRIPGSDALACFYRSRRRERFGEDERALLATLLPHLERAARINDLLGRLEAQVEGLVAVQASSPIGVAYLDARGRVLGANPRAEALVAGLHDRSRSVQSKQARAALERAVAVATGACGPREATILPLERLASGEALLVVVLPIAHHTARPVFERLPRAEAILLATTSGDLARIPEREAARVLGVTPAEAALVLDLVGDADLAEHAARRGITIQTARWRLKRIFEKTGVRRQSELVKLVLATLGRVAPDAAR